MDKAASYRDLAAQCVLMASEETSDGHPARGPAAPVDRWTLMAVEIAARGA